jgi:deoxycytidine triphosphate deaminase
MSNEEVWNNYKHQVEDYIQNHNKLPSQHDKDKNVKQLGVWIGTQKKNYKKQQNIMQDQQIRQQWEAFTTKYQTLFMSNEDIWNNSKNQVENYIQNHNKLPSSTDKDKNIKQLGIWIMTQKKNYNKQQKIMKDLQIREQWEAFTNKYQTFFNKLIYDSKV